MSFTDAVAVILGVGPTGPGSPLVPFEPSFPSLPSLPLRLLNSNASTGAASVPVFDTVTAGVPVVSFTDAVAVIFGVGPTGPGSPLVPFVPSFPSLPSSTSNDCEPDSSITVI